MAFAVRWLVTRPEAALLSDPGWGKTSVLLKAYLARRKAGLVRKLLVVAPKKACYSVWDSSNPTSQLRIWTDFHGLRSVLLHGASWERSFEADADLYVITFDGLDRLLPPKPYTPKQLAWIAAHPDKKRPKQVTDMTAFQALLKRGVDGLLIDELHKLKHSSSTRSRHVDEIADAFKLRWGATGSPAANSLENLFNQAKALDRGAALGRYVTHFRNKYFDETGFGGFTRVPKPEAEQQIFKQVEHLMLRPETREGVRPELIERNIWITLPDDARRAYDEMEDELITAIEREEVTAANAAVASGKCRQIASGGLYLPNGKAVHLHNEKGDALAELVAELQGKPLLVAYETDHDLERINAALGYVAPVINGKTKNREAVELENAWNNDELPVLCGHPLAMAESINLQGGTAAHVAWYTTTWDRQNYEQLIGRVRRRGSKAKFVTCYRIVARDTVEASGVLPALGRKGRTQEGLFTALRDYAKTLRKGKRR